MKLRLPYNKPFIAGKELSYISQAVLNGHLSGDGPYTKQCHQWLQERLGTRRAMLTHSCTAALEMAAILCGLQPGDEVIMPSFTFVSTANAFVLRGAVPVFVDIRPDSATFGKWAGIVLSEKNKRQLLIPAGFAHGFCVLSQTAHVAYKCSDFYNPADEGGIRWSDPDIGIDWPVKNPILSGKDSRLPYLADLTPDRLFRGTGI